MTPVGTAAVEPRSPIIVEDVLAPGMIGGRPVEFHIRSLVERLPITDPDAPVPHRRIEAIVLEPGQNPFLLGPAFVPEPHVPITFAMDRRTFERNANYLGRLYEWPPVSINGHVVRVVEWSETEDPNLVRLTVIKEARP